MHIILLRPLWSAQTDPHGLEVEVQRLAGLGSSAQTEPHNLDAEVQRLTGLGPFLGLPKLNLHNLDVYAQNLTLIACFYGIISHIPKARKI